MLDTPSAFSTRAISVPLAVRVTPASEKVVAPAAAVAVSHEVPLSSDTFTTSPAASAALRVPEMVWAAVLVTKSVALDPVSAEKGTVLTISVGAGAIMRSETSCWPSPVSVRSSRSPTRLEIVAPVTTGVLFPCAPRSMRT